MTEQLDKYRVIILQIIALVAINILGFYYDAQWLYATIAVDLIILGVDINILHNKNKTVKST